MDDGRGCCGRVLTRGIVESDIADAGEGTVPGDDKYRHAARVRRGAGVQHDEEPVRSDEEAVHSRSVLIG